MGQTNVHKNPSGKTKPGWQEKRDEKRRIAAKMSEASGGKGEARELPGEPRDLRELVIGRLKDALEKAGTEFSGPEMINQVMVGVTEELWTSERDKLDQEYLPQLVHSYVGLIFYSMISNERPGAGEWEAAFSQFEGEAWYEHALGLYKNITSMSPEELLAVAAEREARIKGQVEAVRVMREEAEAAKREGREVQVGKAMVVADPASVERAWLEGVTLPKVIDAGRAITLAHMRPHFGTESYENIAFEGVPRVYLIGKVAGNGDWRNQLLGDGRDWREPPFEALAHTRPDGKVNDFPPDNSKHTGLPFLEGIEQYLREPDEEGAWGRSDAFFPRTVFAEGWMYLGPYYMDLTGGHGGQNEDFEGIEHLVNTDWVDPARGHMIMEGEYRDALRRACLRAVRDATHIFAYFDDDSKNAYGSMVELGAAAAMGKPIYVYSSFTDIDLPGVQAEHMGLTEEEFATMRPLGEDLWFGLGLASERDWQSQSVEAAFVKFLLWAGLSQADGETQITLRRTK